MSFLMLYVTHADEKAATELSRALLQRKLVACANIFSIHSAYWWQGVLEHGAEWVSVLKTPLYLGDAVEAAVLELHPYETPCVLRWEVRANDAYERWIHDAVQAP